MTLKQLWLATVTLMLVAALSQPTALLNLVQSSSETLIWLALSLVEQLMTPLLNP